MDDHQRVALVETLTIDDGVDVSAPISVVRYQLSNHLGSVVLEVDNQANVISYEEYHPYGTSAYRAGRSETEVSLKRYRYTGKEKDEETGLYYHGARYYACWLGRWTAIDPIGISDSLNRYSYVVNNPIRLIDTTGQMGEDPAEYGQLSKQEIASQEISALVQELAGADEARGQQIIEAVKILREEAGFSPEGPESAESKAGREALKKQQLRHQKDKERISKIAENRDKIALSAAKGTVVLFVAGGVGGGVAVAAAAYGLGAVGIGATSGFAGGLVSGGGNELLRQTEAGEDIDPGTIAIESAKEGYIGAAVGGLLGGAARLFGGAGTPQVRNSARSGTSRGGPRAAPKKQTSSTPRSLGATDVLISKPVHGADKFRSVPNKQGDPVLVTDEVIFTDDFRDVIETTHRDEPIQLITGIHGEESGGITAGGNHATLDKADFGTLENVEIFDLRNLQNLETRIANAINRPGTTICAFCFSNRATPVLRALGIR
jgi:RHS repeat-associated protein